MNIIKDTSVKKFGLAAVTLLFAIVMFILITPFALIFNIIDSIYKKTIKGFIKYWGWIIYQVWTVIYVLKFSVALCIDFFGNAFCGNLIKRFVLTFQNVPNIFGIGTVTLSAAIGQAQYSNNITKFGLWLSKTLDILFSEENHCLIAYAKWFNDNNGEPSCN